MSFISIWIPGSLESTVNSITTFCPASLYPMLLPLGYFMLRTCKDSYLTTASFVLGERTVSIEVALLGTAVFRTRSEARTVTIIGNVMVDFFCIYYIALKFRIRILKL